MHVCKCVSISIVVGSYFKSAVFKGSICRNKIKSKDSYKNNAVITYGPLEVCGGVCVYRDTALCLYFHVYFLLFFGFSAVQVRVRSCRISTQKQFTDVAIELLTAIRNSTDY